MGLVLASGFYLTQRPAIQSDKPMLIPVTTDRFAPPFTLTDENGVKVSSTSFGKAYQLLYFGFTFCPAVCPTEMAKMAAAIKQLPPDEAHQVKGIFITVDPERDTPDKLQGFVTLFHPAPLALTGSRAEIDKVLKDYKVYAARVETPESSDYTMDHSSFIYFIAPDGRLLHIFKADDTARQITDTISTWLTQETVTNPPASHSVSTPAPSSR